MKLSTLIDRLNLQVRTGQGQLDREVKRGYISDLLSDVLAHCEEGSLWITLQVHPNVVAVASIKGVAAIVLINGREPQEETVEKARQENLPILVSGLSAFELAGRLYGLLGRAGEGQ